MKLHNRDDSTITANLSCSDSNRILLISNLLNLAEGTFYYALSLISGQKKKG